MNLTKPQCSRNSLRNRLLQKVTLFIAFAGIVACSTSSTNADVTVGGAYIVGWRADTPDEISVAIFEEMDAGDQLFFTDSGFYNSGDVRGNEQVMTWTATSSVAAGTVVNITNSATSSDADADEGNVTGELALSATGDQIFIGNSAFPTTNNAPYPSSDLVFGLDYNSTAGWDPEVVSSSTSALPAVLSSHNVAFAHMDNGVYIGPRSGLTVAQYQAAIKDETNWNFSNALSGITLDSTDFQVVPEPTSISLLSLLMLATTCRRRR